MTSDLRASAERLTANCWDTYLKAGDGGRDWQKITDEILGDGRLVATAYLAETDPTGVTPERLPSLGFTQVGGAAAGCLQRGKLVTWESRIHPGERGWRVGVHDVYPEPRTMGQLRTLLRLMGETDE